MAIIPRTFIVLFMQSINKCILYFVDDCIVIILHIL